MKHVYYFIGGGRVERLGEGRALYMFRRFVSYDDWNNLYNSYVRINEWRTSYHRHIDEEGGKYYGAIFVSEKNR
jgi:hypothetical protein